MSKKPAPPVVVNISRDHVSFCSHTAANPITFPFTPTMVADLEVKNKQDLVAKLEEFIKTSQLSASPLVIILGEDTYFSKDFPSPLPPTSEHTQKFIDSIPFLTLSSKLFKTPTGFKLVVINRDLYETIEQAFEKLGFVVQAIVPGFVLSVINAPAQFNAAACRVIYKKLDYLMENSFSNPPVAAGDLYQKEQVFVQKYKLLLIIISLGFMVVSGVTLFLFFTGRIFTTKPKRATSVIPQPTISRSLSTPTPLPPTPTASPSAQQISAVTINILNGSGVAGQAQSVETALKTAGFTQITVGNAPQINSGPAYIVFSQSTPANIRQLIISSITGLLPNLSSRENPDTAYNVIITTGVITP